MKRIITAVFLIASCAALYANNTALDAPASSAIMAQGTTITVQWYSVSYTASPAVEKYNIYRSTSDGLSDADWNAMTPLAAVGDTITSHLNTYTDWNVNTSAALYYRLQTVDASSFYGRMGVTKTAYPYGPVSMTVTAYNSKVRLDWATGYDSNITNYNIYRATSPNITDMKPVALSPSGLYIDPLLYNGITYYYSIAAVSGYLKGAFIQPQGITPFASPFAPSYVTVVVTAPDQVYLNWAGALVQGTYPVAGYTVYSSTSPGFESPSYVTTTGQDVTTTATAGARNYYMVNVFDTLGNSSSAYAFSVYAGLPSQPQGVTVVSYNATSAYITWTAGSTDEGLTGYIVVRSPAFDSNPVTVTDASYSDTGLTPGTVYSYYIQAQNSTGTGILSQAVTITTLPASPSNVMATKGDPGELIITWNPSASAVSDGVTGYNIYRSLYADSFTFTSPYLTGVSSPVTEAAMDCTQTYKYAVKAVSSLTEGQAAYSGAAKALTLPADVTGLTATAFDSYAKISWNFLPVSYEISGYDVYRSITDTTGSYTSVTFTTDNYFYNTGLTDGTKYFYMVLSKNYYGESSTITAAVAAFVPGSGLAPDAPQNVTCVSGGDNKVYLSWSAEPSGSGVTAYNVYRRLDKTLNYDTSPYSVTTTTVFIDSLSVTYPAYYEVRAFSGALISAPSTEVSGKSFLRPGAIDNLQLQDLNGKVFLSWDQPLTVASLQTVTHYNIYRGISTDAYNFITRVAGTTSYMDSAVNTRTTIYYYEIKTVDDEMNEDTSNYYGTITLAGTIMPPPQILAVAGNSRVTLMWRKVAPDYYNIYRKTDPLGAYGAPIFYNVDMESKEYVDSNVAPKTTYYYTIAAADTGGEGPKSNEVSATPYLAPTIPDKTLTAAILNKRDVWLSWKPAEQAVSGGFPIGSYIVKKSEDNGGTYTGIATVLHDASAVSYSITDTATDWDKDYIYMVTVADSEGNTDSVYNLARISLPKAVNKLRVFKNLINTAQGETLTLRFFVIQNGAVKVRIYTLSGDFVKEIASQKVTNVTGSGQTLNPYESQDIIWDGKNQNGERVASGVYIINLETANIKVTAKVAVVK
jgi:hypothetical protein